MKYDNIEDMFNRLDFDIQDPPQGHQERFLKKLDAQKSLPVKKIGKLRMLWTPLLAVAACFLAVVMVTGILTYNGSFSPSSDLASVSPELKETQQFYNSVIKAELARVNEVRSPENEAMVNDALRQLEKLDIEYEKLKKDLKTSGQDKRVIHAIISNFQQRIDLLQDVLKRIETIDELKNPKNENNYL